MEYKILIGDVDITKYVPFPISEQLTLDESLDMGMIRLLYTDKAEPYQPLTSVNIQITSGESERTLYYFVSSDEVTEVIQNNKYNHSIMLIEQTKWLERFIGRTKTVTNPLVRSFEKNNIYVKVFGQTGTNITENVIQTDVYKTPMVTGETTFLSVKEYFDERRTTSLGTPTRCLLEITKNGMVVASETDYTKDVVVNLSGGIFDVKYEWVFIAGAETYIRIEETFQITAVRDTKDAKDKNITEVVNAVLATIETLRESETPRFSFNSEQATRYSKVDAPEFTLTGTLWEQLSTIGEYIHSIPRLRNNVIYFDELGVNDNIGTPLDDYLSSVKKFDIEQFALSLDSNVDNFVNTANLSDAGITEPFNTGLKTVRTDVANVTLAENNIYIETKYPIEKIIRVTCGYLDGGTSVVGDITQYVYEESEYLTLSSYSDVYPLSKGFALKYVTGRNNITELDFKLPSEINPIFEDYAIVNIIKNETGQAISQENILKLQFRVTYIPVISGRVKQAKSYIGDIATNSSLAYNQMAQKISSIAYGEALKGAIDRLGNPEISRVYLLNDISLIPEVGKRFDDDYYVSAIKCEYYRDFIRCEVLLSKNFNKLNEYVGIKNEVRFYEISERQAVDSQILYEDYCVIGNDFESDNKSILVDKSNFANYFMDIPQHEYSVVSMAEVTGYSKGIEHESVLLPVSCFALGNALLFNFRYEDSYSAGNTIIQQGATRVQYQLPYTDERGELDSLKIRLGNTISQVSNYAEAVEKGDLLPKSEVIKDNPNNKWAFDTGNDKIVILKDNREMPTFNYQMHFISNNKNLIIGKYFTEYNPFVTHFPQRKKIVVFGFKIDKFQERFDSSIRYTVVKDYTIQAEVDGNTIDLGSFIVPSVVDENNQEREFYGWAMVDDANRIYLAEMFPQKLKAGDEVKLPKFTFTHKLR